MSVRPAWLLVTQDLPRKFRVCGWNGDRDLLLKFTFNIVVANVPYMISSDWNASVAA